MSAALKYASPPQSSDGARATAPPTPANDNCYLHLLMTEVDGNAITYLHTERHCRGLLQLDLIHRIKSLGYAQPFAKHPGSLAAGTNASGTSLWIEQPKTTSSLSLRAHSTPFGESLINNSANDDLANYTGHIRDKATGLNYMHPKGISSRASPLRAQARYQDPVIGRFLSIDPVGFKASSPGSFGRYTYGLNDPINMIDPNGKEAWLVSRPLGARGTFGQNHMFVAVRNDTTGAITRFSYGPQGNLTSPGKLVSLSGNGGRTDVDDGNALSSFLANPAAAAENGISAATINAPDADVIASGNAVNSVLGTQDNPASTAPGYNILPSDASPARNSAQFGQIPATPGTANSNSAAYAVADRANPNVTQAVPNKGNNPGQRQHVNIPRPNYATRIKRD